MLPKDLFLDFYRSNEEQLGTRVAARNMAFAEQSIVGKQGISSKEDNIFEWIFCK